MEKSDNLVDMLGRTGDADKDESADDLFGRIEKDVQSERSAIAVSQAMRFLIRFGKGHEGLIVF